MYTLVETCLFCINSETICAVINEIGAAISAILCSNNYIFSTLQQGACSFATKTPPLKMQ
jgi:hypothetical protein